MNKLNTIISLLTAIACYGSANANDITFSFEEEYLAGVTLKYRKAEIGNSAEQPLAMVIYLHGGSSKGDDNMLQMQEKGIDSISNYLAANNIGALMIVPQCPTDYSWGANLFGAIKALIDRYAAMGIADKDRIYLFGGSMGGTATWNMVSAYPGLFAAAMPVAGNPSKCTPENVAKTPIYTVMGTADMIMDIPTVEHFADEVAQFNGFVSVEIEEGWTHETTCIESYTGKRLSNVMSHRKQHETGCIDTEATNKPTTTNGNICISINGIAINSYNAPQGIYIVNGKKVMR